jgi:hypothetical protein
MQKKISLILKYIKHVTATDRMLNKVQQNRKRVCPTDKEAGIRSKKKKKKKC